MGRGTGSRTLLTVGAGPPRGTVIDPRPAGTPALPIRGGELTSPNLRNKALRQAPKAKQMTKFMAIVEYDGTAYHGWQLQKALPTIQGRIEDALERILGTPTRVHGSGRTDAGVHAVGQVAHFVSNWSRSVEELKRGCNALLPPDITLLKLEPAPEDFHARHSAHSKTYVYKILNLPLRSPLNRLYSWHVQRELDLQSMNRAAEYLGRDPRFCSLRVPHGRHAFNGPPHVGDCMAQR